MKKNFMKKVFAVSLSVAFACTFASAVKPVTASAATAYVKLRTDFKTLKVNQSVTMTLKNNSLGWQVSKVTTSKKDVATVYDKNKKAATFKIKGKSEGTAVIRATLKTAARKKNNVKTLKCVVRVKPADVTPPDDPKPVVTEATAATQAELDSVITGLSAEGNTINKVTIAAETAANLTIPAGSFPTVDLIVNAPAAEITNNATFKSIEIQAIKDSTWTENATGNKFTVTAGKARVIVSAGASVASMTVNKADAAVDLVVNGTLADVTVSQKAAVTISGETKTAVNVTVNAADASLTASAPVAVTSAVKTALVFEKGAESSTVKIGAKNVIVKVTNNTTGTVEITKADDTKHTVNAGEKDVELSTPATPETPAPGIQPPALKALEEVAPTAALFVSTGAIQTVSEGAIKVALDVADLYDAAKNADFVSGGSIKARVVDKDGNAGAYVSADETKKINLEIGLVNQDLGGVKSYVFFIDYVTVGKPEEGKDTPQSEPRRIKYKFTLGADQAGDITESGNRTGTVERVSES